MKQRRNKSLLFRMILWAVAVLFILQVVVNAYEFLPDMPLVQCGDKTMEVVPRGTGSEGNMVLKKPVAAGMNTVVSFFFPDYDKAETRLSIYKTYDFNAALSMDGLKNEPVWASAYRQDWTVTEQGRYRVEIEARERNSVGGAVEKQTLEVSAAPEQPVLLTRSGPSGDEAGFLAGDIKVASNPAESTMQISVDKGIPFTVYKYWLKPLAAVSPLLQNTSSPWQLLKDYAASDMDVNNRRITIPGRSEIIGLGEIQ